MENPEEFILRYIRERTAVIRKELEAREPLRRMFFTPGCLWDSRAYDAEKSAGEQILKVSAAGDGFEVTTQETGWAAFFPKRRYHLQSDYDTWRIHKVEFECPPCGGTGVRKESGGECFMCQGKGWCSAEDLALRAGTIARSEISSGVAGSLGGEYER